MEAEIISGCRPRIRGVRDGAPAPAGWEAVYSQAGACAWRLGSYGVVPQGCEAVMDEYTDALSGRRQRVFPAGTHLRLVRRGDPHATAVVRAWRGEAAAPAAE